MDVKEQSRTADMQYNLGVTYYTLPSGDRQANLEKAITSFQAALQSFTRTSNPENWARTQQALGNVYRDLPSGDRQANLQRAITCYKAALEVYTPQSAPSYHDSTQADMERAMALLNAVKKGQPLSTALAKPPAPSERLWVILLSIAIALVIIVAGVASIIYFTRSSDKGMAHCVDGNLAITSSTALAPALQAVASDYQTKCNDSNITLNILPSRLGLSNLETGSVQMDAADMFADTATQSDLVDHQVSAVIFALVINSKVTGVSNLTTQQIQAIYSGTTTDWKDLGGNDLAITLISRPPSSGTVSAFEQYVLCSAETVQGPQNLQSDSTNQLAQTVKSTDGALGYITLEAAHKSGLTILSINGQAPTPDAVKSGAYKFWSVGHLYTKGAATGLTKALIDYMSTDTAKQVSLSNDSDFLSFSGLPAASQASHQQGVVNQC